MRVAKTEDFQGGSYTWSCQEMYIEREREREKKYIFSGFVKVTSENI